MEYTGSAVWGWCSGSVQWDGFGWGLGGLIADQSSF